MPASAWDVFVSYASEDRLSIVLPLVGALEARGLRVWFDQRELDPGDRLRTTIGDGLARSRVAVVVLSRQSLAKRWPRDEWSAVMALEEDGRARLVPVRYDVTTGEVAAAFPLVADRLSLDVTHGVDLAADAIARMARPASPTTVATTLIDCAHGQDNWDQLVDRASESGGLTPLRRSWLEEPDTLERARVLVVPPPFHRKLSGPEIDHVERWVERGGGLLVLGCYDLRHHASNCTDLAWRFDFEFGHDVVLPPGGTEVEARTHVFSRDPQHGVAAWPSLDHPLVAGVDALTAVSSASVWTTTQAAPELVVESDRGAVLMRPLGRILPDGSRPAIEVWSRCGTGPVTLVAARRWGKGRVVVAGTWKLYTVNTAGNRAFLANALTWLAGD